MAERSRLDLSMAATGESKKDSEITLDLNHFGFTRAAKRELEKKRWKEGGKRPTCVFFSPNSVVTLGVLTVGVKSRGV